ncbi:transcriptional regulator [Altererythrobacter sp. BO-6]|uniref:winged helix-turn-helix domain-containing protein n=1 Tax=Altererythrobacter sp. BO-6 TaxID=2604537 RepID=UPI0013E1DF6E|nr:transcriptional regulator [Altererythrobacter sp. BO-6]QIG53749.1 transcriptional regulator [Altererythrobacter sp. BO-6]
MDTRSGILRFDAFELDCDNRQLSRDGQPIELGSRYFDALALLVARRGELVTKEAFMEGVWHGIPVTDEALTQCIRTVRRALGDDASNPRFIHTVPKHGYRFAADLSSLPDAVGRLRVSPVAGACAAAGLAAGAIAGLIYGIIAGTGGGAQILILSAMVGALGLLAGAGLGGGMAAALTWRGRAGSSLIAGAATGGLLVGALGNLLGREGIGLLSGVSIASVTGPFEGLVLGTATGFAAWAALAGWRHGTVIVTGVFAGAAASALIFFSGGTLLAGSLLALEEGVPGTRLDMVSVGYALGEQGLTRMALGLTLVIESLIFVLAIGSALLAVRHRCRAPTGAQEKNRLSERG